MDLGQMNMMQMPINATAIVAETASPIEQAGEFGGSVFAGILGEMTPQTVVVAATGSGVSVPQAVMMGVVQSEVETVTFTAGEAEQKEKAARLTEVPLLKRSSEFFSEKELYEIDSERKVSEDVLPQNVVVISAEAAVLIPRDVLPLPESERPSPQEEQIASEEPAEQLKAAYNAVVPVEVTTQAPLLTEPVAVKAQPVETVVAVIPQQTKLQTVQTAQPIASEVRTQQFRDAYSVADAPEVNPQSATSGKVTQNTATAEAVTAVQPQVQTRIQTETPATSAAVTTEQTPAAQAAKPIVSEVRTQQLRDAYSVAVAPEVKPQSATSAKVAQNTATAEAVTAAQTAQLIVSEVRTQTFGGEYSVANAPEVKPQSATSAKVTQNTATAEAVTAAQPQVQTPMQIETPVTSAAVTTEQTPAAQAAKPIVSEVRTQQFRGEYSVADTPEVKTSSPVAVTVAENTATAEAVTTEKMDAETTKKTLQNVTFASLPKTAEATAVNPKPQVPVQQFMEAYSMPFETAAKDSRPVAVSSAIASPAVESQAESLQSQHSDKTTSTGLEKAANGPATPGARQNNHEPAASRTSPVSVQVPEIVQTLVPPPPVQRAIEPAAIAMDVKPLGGSSEVRMTSKEEQQNVVTSAATTKSTVDADNLIVDAVHAAASATPGEDALYGKSSFNGAVNGAQINHNIQHQTKTEATASVTVTANPPEVTEQVARQVGEHLSKNEIRTGGEQIVLRLSPENLGELKVNLRMENQRLTVEIITDNRTVRDSLLQNADTLKESLAKQNIKMDSFDVSTGSNNGSSGRDQKDWRELVRQQQQNAWKADSGYRLPSMGQMLVPAARLVKSAHSMLDIHY